MMKILSTIFLVCSMGWSVAAHSQDTRNALQDCTFLQLIKNECALENDSAGGTKNKGLYENDFVTECPPNIVFLLDGSDSVSPTGFRQAQESLVREIRAVNQAFANSNVGVVLFSDTIEEIPLQERTLTQINDLATQVQNLRQPRKKTTLSLALKRARQMLLDYSVIESRAYNGIRSGSIIVTLTDGITENNKEIIQEAKLVKNSGILVISLSIEKSNLELLKDISRTVQNHTEAIKWSSLVGCPAKVLDAVQRGRQCRDFLMVMDGSDSVLLHQEVVRQYLTHLSLRYRRVSNAIGINIYGTDSQFQASNTRIRLEENKYDLVEKIRQKLMFPTSGGTGTDRAVSQSVTMLDDDIRGKSSALVLVTDGLTLDRQATRDAIQRARASGYLVIIIRVGAVLTDDELNFISGWDWSNIFSIASFSDLFSVDFDNRVCDVRPDTCVQACPGNTVRGPNCSCLCPDGSLNQQTGTCERSGTCIQPCPANSVRGSNCSCLCSDGSFNQQTWTCERSSTCNQPCPANSVRGSNCSCLCSDGSFNQQTWTCERSLTCLPCPANSVRGSNCSCLCSDGRYFNQQTWTCVCPQECPTNARRDGACGCQCLDFNQIYNPVTNQCVRSDTCIQACPANYVRGPNCSCICPEGNFNQQTWTCERSLTCLPCPANSVRGSNCTCLCSDGRYFNQQTWTCDGCPYNVNPTNANEYFNKGNTMQLYYCQPGNVMDLTLCRCVTGSTPNPIDSCPYSVNPSNPNEFFYKGNTLALYYCQTGNVMNLTLCRCVTGSNPNPIVCAQECPSNARRVDTCGCQCLTNSQIYDSVRNQCVAPACPNECPADARRTINCGCQCLDNRVYNSSTNQCAREYCSRSEYPCENNQVAYRDCNGYCYCACTAGFAGTRCEIRLQAELCNDCYYDNGHYHAGVVGYCDLFVSCVPLNGATNSTTRPTSFVPSILSCPLGTFYITRPDGWKGCDFLQNGVCSQDQCATLPANARYPDRSSCQSYWQCGSNRRLISKGCCPAGQRFDPSSTLCVTDNSCPVTCGANRTNACPNGRNDTDDSCPFNVNPTNPNEFFYKGNPLELLHCQPADAMNLTLCRCVTGSNPNPIVCRPTVDINFEQISSIDGDHVPRIQVPGGQAGRFSGADDVMMKMFAGSGFWTDYFQINLRLFLPRAVMIGQRTAVVTNADCNKEESVSITMDDRNFYFKIFQLNIVQPAEITIPYFGRADSDGWFSLTLLYRRVSGQFELSGTVGSYRETYRGSVALSANIDSRTCALHLGQGFQYAGLIAQVDDFQVWRCNPRP